VIVAIDGPAGSGKSAVGSRVASALGLPFVDSGLLYRAVACAAVDRHVDLDDEEGLTRLAHSVTLHIDGRTVEIDHTDLTGRVYAPELSEGASRVGRVAGVRLALVAHLRRMGRGGVVMAGRDIGTVVFPDSPHKFYLTASVEERATRRALQIEARGEEPDEVAIRQEVLERDRRDSQRAVAPLRAADDAVVLETDGLSLTEVVAEVVAHVQGD
jgi:cytidylate kinase